MSLRSKVLNALMKKGKLVTDASSREEIFGIIELLQPVSTGVDLVRIGGDGDGGYLVPDDFDGITHCFSPGVSEVANFEEELASAYGVRSFLADASVEAPPIFNEMFEFDKKFLGTRDAGDFVRLSTWIDEKLPASRQSELILQMDIEGAEFDVLAETSPEVLRKFRIIIIEFHGLDMLLEKKAARFMKPLFEKLANDFVVVHAHPNNYRPPVMSEHGIAVPRILEISFLRKDRVRFSPAHDGLNFPHKLDQRNVPSKNDIPLPDVWWKPTARHPG